MPKEICFDAYNYSSKRDIVPKAELAFRSFFDPSECGASKTVE